ncbi:MAG: hypothetical protein IJV70_01400 [Clostridia bacterium]|nr:hypothetical protein [Clostridia bacterium]
MQEIYNAAWYAGNEEVKYPLDSNASGYDLSGNALPTALITDIRLMSAENEKIFYISGVTCSEYLISVVIASQFGTEAAVTLPQPVAPLTHYPLECFHDSLQGVIAFGHTQEKGQWRFDSPSQSGISPSCIVRLKPWPVPSLGIRNHPLTGDIVFEAGTAVTIRKETVYLGETRAQGISGEGLEEVQALVFHLSPSDTGDGDPTGPYRGECDQRPENGDCNCITSLGGAVPDETGNVRIRLVTDASASDLYAYTALQFFGSTEEKERCQDNLCQGVQLTIQDEKQEREPMNFGRCGQDPCEEASEDVIPYRLNRPGVLPEDFYPLTGTGLSYLSGVGLQSESIEPAVAVTDTHGSYVSASFTRSQDGTCGIVYGILNPNRFSLFSYDGETLRLGSKTLPLSTRQPELTFILAVENHQLTGELFAGRTLAGSLTVPVTELGQTGVYLHHSLCKSWRIQ